MVPGSPVRTRGRVASEQRPGIQLGHLAPSGWLLREWGTWVVTQARVQQRHREELGEVDCRRSWRLGRFPVRTVETSGVRAARGSGCRGASFPSSPVGLPPGEVGVSLGLPGAAFLSLPLLGFVRCSGTDV